MRHPRSIDYDVNPDVIDRRGADPPNEGDPDQEMQDEAPLVRKSDAQRAVHRAAAASAMIAGIAAFFLGRSLQRGHAGRRRTIRATRRT